MPKALRQKKMQTKASRQKQKTMLHQTTKKCKEKTKRYDKNKIKTKALGQKQNRKQSVATKAK